MAGRKPKPTALKKLEGNLGKRKLNTKEPVPGKGMPDCLKWLLPEAKEEWKRLCQKLSDMGVLTEIDMASLEGRDCYAGLDLSSTGDITALVLMFPPRDADEKYILLPFFWVPDETIPQV